MKISRISGIKLCKFAEYTKNYLKFDDLSEFENKVENSLVGYWQLRLVLWAKPVENKKIS
jgi:hypothetical protein